jgi:predicted dehydrogenase
VRLGYKEPDPSAVIEIDRIGANRTHMAEIVTRSGATYVWRDGDLLVERPGRGEERLVTAGEEPLVREINAFLRSVRTGEEARSDGRFGARVVEVVERIGQLLQPVNGAPLRAGVPE